MGDVWGLKHLLINGEHYKAEPLASIHICGDEAQGEGVIAKLKSSAGRPTIQQSWDPLDCIYLGFDLILSRCPWKKWCTPKREAGAFSPWRMWWFPCETFLLFRLMSGIYGSTMIQSHYVCLWSGGCHQPSLFKKYFNMHDCPSSHTKGLGHT